MRREGREEGGQRGRETVGKRRKDMINEIGQKKKKAVGSKWISHYSNPIVCMLKFSTIKMFKGGVKLECLLMILLVLTFRVLHYIS